MPSNLKPFSEQIVCPIFDIIAKKLTEIFFLLLKLIIIEQEQNLGVLTSKKPGGFFCALNC